MPENIRLTIFSEMEYRLSSAYRSLEDCGIDPTDWHTCPVCEAKPKKWSFDNGRFAACKCFGMYEPKVSATSIGEYYQKHKTLQGYPEDELRDNWNRHVVSVNRKKVIREVFEEDIKTDFLPF
jgi:hypothetical protein